MALKLNYAHVYDMFPRVFNDRKLHSMKRHKLNFTNRTVTEQLAICRRVADGVVNVPEEHRHHFTAVNLPGKLTDAEAAHAEVERLKVALKSAVSRRNDTLRHAREGASAAASGLVIITNGEPADMLAAGLGVMREKQPVGLPSAPANLRVLPTDFEGRVPLRWERSVRRCVFNIEATTDPAARTGWKRIQSSTKQSTEATGLASGKRYWFRVCAVNAHGTGPWRQPVSVWVK